MRVLILQLIAAVTISLLSSTVYAGLLGQLLGSAASPVPVSQTPIASSTSDPSVRIRQVAFEVKNVNRSLILCLADGKTYTIRGQIVSPVGNTEPTATLYLHGLGYGNFFWRFNAVAGLNYAVEQARLGHTSVVIDRIGYDTSDHPKGLKTCIGAQADIAHQIVNQLRSGSYTVDQGNPRQYQRIALAGHSAGGLIAQVTAYSFGNVDALAVISYGDLGASINTLSAVTESLLICALGGQPAEPGQPSGYAFFGQTEAAFQSLHFFDAQAEVLSVATALRNRDPCGDFASLATGIALDAIRIGSIDVPVLVVCGNEDAVFPPPACQVQSKLYIGTTDLTTSFIDGIGHAITLETRAPVFRGIISEWLTQRGF